MIEKFTTTVEIPKGYELMLEAFKAALERAAVGKGRQRHAKHDNQPLEEQDIYLFSHDWRTDQVAKKAREIRNIRGKRDKANEALDIIIYIMVEWDVLITEMNREIARRH